ncbi:hypothetical protein ACFL2V_17420 [Pseudomonadota bacterium]
MNRLLYVIFCAVLLWSSSAVNAAEETPWQVESADGMSQVYLYFFWSPSCPHCQKAHEYIDLLPQQYPWLVLRSSNIFEANNTP